jgi:hypothetical protein
LERLVDHQNGSPADFNGVSDRPVAGTSSKAISRTTETSSVPLPSRSQRRHAAAEESFERSLLLLFVLLTLLGGVTVVADITVPQEVPPPPVLEVPNLNGARSLEEAREMAGENFVVEGLPVESGEPVGTVVSQAPKPGETAGEGTTISVRISGTQIEVLPNVEGMTIEEAKQSIRSRPFGLEVETVESSMQEVGRVLRQEPKGGNGVTAEAGTYVALTVGGGPSTAKVPDRRAPHPEETYPKPGDGLGTSNDPGPAGHNVEQRLPAETEVEPHDSARTGVEPRSEQATISGVMGFYAEEDVAPFDYASWLEESGQYDGQ